MTIQKMIIHALNQQPDKIALSTENLDIKYHQLKKYINSFIYHFDKVSNKFVIVIMGKRINYALSLIGLLFSRLIFVPCSSDDDINITLKKIQEINAKSVLIDKFISKELMHNINKLNLDITYIEDILSLEVKSANPKEYLEEDPVYVYFTSGTTGTPKAILGKNQSLAHYVEWEINKFEINFQDKFAQITNVAFDPYLRDILVPICSGAQIYFPNDNFLLSINSFLKWLNSNNISIIHCTPIILNIIVKYIKDYHTLNSLKWIFLAGERPIISDITTCLSNSQNINFVNLYGPTESTMANMYYIIQRNIDYDEIPVGEPISDVKVLLKNKNGGDCKDNEIGEIYFESNYLSYGYLNYDNKSFIKTNLYKTGDLAIKTDKGYVLKGRNDNCIKIYGIKVNISEIEKTIEKIFPIQKSVILFYDSNLYAFILSDFQISYKKIVSELSKYFNKTIIPKFYINIDKWPVTKNGKIDYKKLEERINNHNKVK